MKRFRNAPLALLVALSLILPITAPALALNPAAGLTSTGQTLTIEITSPATGSRVNVPPGTVTVTGTTSVGPLLNSGNVMYVVDVSGSTLSPANQDCNGDGAVNAGDDLNGDGQRGTTLDCEISGVVALNQSLAGAPGASGGLVVFGQTAAIGDVDPTAGQQNFTSPLNADKNSAGGSDLEQAARSIRVGTINLFTAKNVGQQTNFNDALTQLATAFAPKTGQHNIAFFLSDGQATLTTGPGSPLAAVVAAGIRVNTYSVGTASTGCATTAALKVIATATGGTCTVVTNPAQLSSVLVQPVTVTKVEVSLNGAPPVQVASAAGPWTANLTGLVGGIWNTVTATVTASDGTRQTADIQIYGNQAPVANPGGPYVVDEGSPLFIGAMAYDPDGDAITVSWAPSANLSDAAIATPTFLADDNGTYPLSMTVSDPYGMSGTAATTVTVRNVAPTGMLVNGGPGPEGAGVVVSFAAPSDPSAADLAAGLHFVFDCNGGDLSGATYATAGTDPHTVCTYDDGPSDHLVKARIYDKDGGWNEYATTVSITNVAPVAAFGNSGPVDEGSPVALTFSGAFDPSTADTAAGFHYAFACDGAPFGAADYATAGLTGATTCTFDDGNAAQMVRGRIIDKDGGYSDYTGTVSVKNVAPTAVLGNNGPIDEGGAVTVSFSAQHDPSAADTAAGFHYAFACDGGDLSGATYASSGTAASATCTFDDGPGARLIRARIIDKDGGASEYTTTVMVQNVAPTALLGNSGPVDEGSMATVSFAGAHDPSAADTAAGFHYAFACDGGDLSGATYASSGTAAAMGCSFDDGPSTRLVKGRIIDKDGGFTEYSTAVTVRNVAPTASLTAPASLDEGSAFTLALVSPFDPSEADTLAGFTMTYDCGDGAGFHAGAACTAIDNPSQVVKARIADKDGGMTEYTATIAVANVAPTVGAIGAPTAPTAVGTTVAASASFTDPGMLDTHTAVFDWGDGGTSAGAVTEAGGNGSATGSHAYTTPGIYTIRLTVTDKDGGVGTAIYQYVVVYDPDGGFVTGGGWFNSPAGAYAADPSLTGRANFGFNSKYQKGATVPTGQTQFQFKAGNLNFHSTSYEWLVVAGARAQYKGFGTINGTGNYRFMLTAIDGQVSGGGGVDKLRIKIWDAATGGVVYDNQMGGADDANPSMAIDSGSIVIHK